MDMIMSKPGFPKIREDGSFTVRAWFRTADVGVIDLVRAYVQAWSTANRTWVRIWRGNRIKVEELSFSAEFSSDPRVEVNGVSRFAVILEGKASSSRLWKDWAVRLVSDISNVFPECNFESFES